MMRLLIVDDEPTYLPGLRAHLKGANIEATRNAEAALALLEMGEHFDCAIVDYTLPKMDGLSFVRKVRARGDRMGVVMVTEKGRTTKDNLCDGLSVWSSIYKETSPGVIVEKLEAAKELAEMTPERESAIIEKLDEEIAAVRMAREHFDKPLR